MFTFERSHDWEEIRKVLTHPLVWRGISDDTAPPRSEFDPAKHLKAGTIEFFRVTRAGELMGYWTLLPTERGHEVHTCLLPISHGRAQEAGREFVSWVWANIPECSRLITGVPVKNRLAMALSKAVGMQEFQRLPGAFVKHHEAQDVVCLELRRPE